MLSVALVPGVAARAQQAAPAGADAAVSTIQEIVVTANKREERLQDVPADVSVVGRAQLAQQNITDTTSLTQAVPSLTLAGGTIGGLEIRGIGTASFARSSEQSVSTVTDGVVLDRSRSQDLYDIDHVEVLNGPQGMLFGKNASAGVVNIVTRAPEIGKTELIGHLDAGDLDYVVGRLIANLPLGEDAALRISGHYDAYGHTIYNGFLKKWDHEDSPGVRARLLWEPTSDLTVNIVGNYDVQEQNGVNSGVGPLRTVLPATGNPNNIPANLTGAALTNYNAVMATLANTCGVTVGPKNNRTCTEGVNADTGGVFYPSKFYLLSGQVDWRRDGYILTSITAARRSSYGDSSLPAGTPGNDADSTPSDWLSSNLSSGWANTFSEELRLTSPATDRIAYVAGLYASSTIQRANVSQTGIFTPAFNGAGGTPNCVATPCTHADFIRIDQSSYAAFGQLTFHVTDRFRLLAGARETHDALQDVTQPFSPAGFIPLPAAQQFLAVNIKDTRDNFSWRLGAQADIAHDVMAYATAARGYKGALVNDQLSNNGVGQPLVQPEIPMDYEVGLKATVLDGRLATDVALFHDKVKDFQTTIFLPPVGATPAGFATGNVPYVITQGVELSVFGKPFENFSLNGGVLYDDARYSPNYLVACSQLLTPGVGGCAAPPAPKNTPSVTHLFFAPQWKVSLSAEYDVPLTGFRSGLTGYAQADVVYTTKFNYAATPDPNLVAPDETRLGARIGVRSDKGWEVAVFARNLLDQRIPTYVQADPLATANGLASRSYNQGLDYNSYRLIGISLDARY
jgi:iron complex outermembrane receptor protein